LTAAEGVVEVDDLEDLAISDGFDLYGVAEDVGVEHPSSPFLQLDVR
jgi:hypothetical protein